MRDFDELLGEVLKEDAQTEPRPGMERRILARVRETEPRGAGWVRGWWLGAASLAACLVVAIATYQRPGRGNGSHMSAPVVAVPPTVVANRDSRDDAGEASDLKGAPHHHEANARSLHVGSGLVAAGVQQAREERLPKMETFPAVTQRGGLLAEPESGNAWDGVRAIAESPQVAQAMQELKAEQERPLEVSAIEIKPL